MRIVALSGPKFAGKSTVVADHLVHHHGFKRLRFAGPFKAMLYGLGLSADEVEGHLKEQPCARLGGKTPRYAMETLGEDWGKGLIGGPDMWTNTMRLELDEAREQGVERIVIDDLRRFNEALMLHWYDADVWRIRRPIVEKPYTPGMHISERDWRAIPARLELFNDGSPEQTRALVDLAVQGPWP